MVHLLLALATKNSWEVHHLDVKTTFLNGDIKEQVYVMQPEGYVKEGQENLVYRLFKAIYGLRQVPRAWYAKLNGFLESLGFVRCPYEHAVDTKRVGKESLIIGVYVDDIIVTGTNVKLIKDFKEQMNNKFHMSDMEKLWYYLGIEVKHGVDCIELKQSGYARNVLEKAGMAGCNPTNFPMNPKVHITKDEGGTSVNPTLFKSMVGGLRYLVHTRLGIAFSVGIVSRFMEIWLRKVLKQITDEQIDPVVIYIDNKSTIDLAKNPTFHGCNKHIDIRYHFIGECVERGEIIVKHVSGENQIADSLTKALFAVKFDRMRKLMGMKILDGQV